MNNRVMLAVIIIVGATLLGGLGGIIGLSLAEPARTIPDVLQNVTIGSLTMLGGLLINPRAVASGGARRAID